MANTFREWFEDITKNIDLPEDFEFNIESELPENFKEEFHKQWLTPTAAKNNPDIMSHYKGKYLSSADLKLKKGLVALGFTEAEWDAFKEEEPDTLKLLDLAFDKIKARKSIETSNNKSDNKEFEAYKKQTIKEFEELKSKYESQEETFNTKIQSVNDGWRGKLRDAKFNELLSSKTFDSTLPAEDVRMLIRSKINDSNYDIRMDDDLTFKIYDKANPEMEAVKEGKKLTINDILDEYASTYTAKNDQPTTRQSEPQKRTVEVTTAGGGDEGYYTVGHPNYGKKPI